VSGGLLEGQRSLSKTPKAGLLRPQVKFQAVTAFLNCFANPPAASGSSLSSPVTRLFTLLSLLPGEQKTEPFP